MDGQQRTHLRMPIWYLGFGYGLSVISVASVDSDLEPAGERERERCSERERER